MRIGVGLSIPELATRGGRFSPASLFTSGVAGAWYDPSDINNYMAGLGPELVTNGDFSSSSSWTLAAGSGGSATISGGALTLSGGTSSFPNATQSTILTSGKYYSVTVVMSSAVTSGSLALRMGGGTATYQLFTSAGTYTLTLLADGTDLRFIRNSGFSDTAVIDSISVKEVTGIANATLFQDSAGTTPVTAVEQPVGLMLDKSQGLAITPTAIDGNLNTATWTKGTGWSAPSARSLVCDGTQTATSDTSASYVKPTGALVRWSFTISAISGTLSVYPTGGNPATITTTGAKTVVSDATTNFNIFRMNAGNTCTITDIRIEIIAGNHASQATAASRPVLRARYNLLTYSEQFDNAAWSKTATTCAGAEINATTAPDGTLTADKIVETTATSGHVISNSGTVGVTQNVASVYLKKGTGATAPDWIQLYTGGVSAQYANFNLATASVGNVAVGSTATITSVGNGWYRCTLNFTPGSAGSVVVAIAFTNNTDTTTRGPSYAGAITSDVFVWGADLRTGSSAGTYQRIAAATDYATAGFLPYLYFVTDDSFGTNSIDFTATDAMFSCVGITKNSDAANALVYELSADITSNNGAVNLFAPIVSGGLNTYYAASKGTVSAIAGTGTGVYVAPITNVVSTVSDISTPSLALRVNGSQVATSTATQGTGNFGNYPLFIGRRNNATLPLNGNLYQLIVCGKTLSASELASTEAYVNARTGAY